LTESSTFGVFGRAAAVAGGGGGFAGWRLPRCADANCPASHGIPTVVRSQTTRATATFRGSLPGSFFRSSSVNPPIAMPSAISLRASCSPCACFSRLAFPPRLRGLWSAASPALTFARRKTGCPNTSPAAGRFGGRRHLRGWPGGRTFPGPHRAPDHPTAPPSDDARPPCPQSQTPTAHPPWPAMASGDAGSAT